MRKLLLTLLTFAILPGSSLAATVMAEPTSQTVGLGGSTTISVNLVLDPVEAASLLELTLDLTGGGTIVTTAVLTPCGGWEGLRDGTISDVQATVSCTSQAQDQVGTVLSAELSVTGLALGSFQVLLGADSFAQRDTDTPPFVEDVPLSPSAGTLLATVTVPEPGTALLGGSALAALAGLRWGARHPRMTRRRKTPQPA